MQFSALLSALAVASAALAARIPVPETTNFDILCPNAKVLDTKFIGEDKNVKMQTLQCDLPLARRNVFETRAANANVCGAQCDTNCFNPSGGGPDPNECHVITDALLFDSQNTGDTFNITSGGNGAVVTLQYKICKTFFVNQASPAQNLTYCRTDFAAVNDFVASNCQSQQNAHGGNCIAADGRWFIQ